MPYYVFLQNPVKRLTRVDGSFYLFVPVTRSVLREGFYGVAVPEQVSGA
jgi:hypothetical protein